MDQSGAPHAVSLSCDINMGKNQSDYTNCLKCLRMWKIYRGSPRKMEPDMVMNNFWKSFKYFLCGRQMSSNETNFINSTRNYNFQLKSDLREWSVSFLIHHLSFWWTMQLFLLIFCRLVSIMILALAAFSMKTIQISSKLTFFNYFAFLSTVINFLELSTTSALPGGARNLEYAHHCLEQADGDIEVALELLLGKTALYPPGHHLADYKYDCKYL